MTVQYHCENSIDGYLNDGTDDQGGTRNTPPLATCPSDVRKWALSGVRKKLPCMPYLLVSKDKGELIKRTDISWSMSLAANETQHTFRDYRRLDSDRTRYFRLKYQTPTDTQMTAGRNLAAHDTRTTRLVARMTCCLWDLIVHDSVPQTVRM